MLYFAAQVVLGGYYGTGNKGGLISVFLLGVYSDATGQWLTVCYSAVLVVAARQCSRLVDVACVTTLAAGLDLNGAQVCKCGNGFDDATIDRLQREIKVR